MGAIKNYLINHPEIMEMQRFDEGYRLAKQEEERYWELYQDELTELNTLLTMDVDNEYKNNYYATQKSNS